MYKLIVTDLDGTLLNSHGEVSKTNIDTIKLAISKGVEVILASGRPVEAMRNYALEIGASKYIISGNGAIIYNLEKNKIVYKKQIKKTRVEQIAKACEENSIFYCVYTKDKILTKSLDYSLLFFYAENTRKPQEKQTRIEVIPNLLEYIREHSNEEYFKISIFDKDRSVFGSIMRKLKKVKNVDILQVEHMSTKLVKLEDKEIKLEYFYTEITAKNINKWTALKFLLRRFRIRKKNVIAIGDNFNDKEMLEKCGMGVVMGNSTPNMRMIGKLLTSSNDDDGVAKAVKKLVL
ncbi:MAG: Cof-type HAD-IIB family hydrolase [Lachnospiraceae bacterium]|nr:Cof-type HAD-IIB family hydrolase [Lachnospiraceae bacterium]